MTTRTRVRASDVREDQQAASRETPALGRGEALGRDGKPIRRVKVGDDKFAVPPEIIEQMQAEGWVYQWNVVSTLGKEDPVAQATLARAGWTPVPAERHPGIFLPVGSTGPVIIDGLRLDERPWALEEEARIEHQQEALDAVNGARKQFGMKTSAPGFDHADVSSNPAVRRNTFAKVSREAVTMPRPKYEMSVD
jgi:hypothetical protein